MVPRGTNFRSSDTLHHCSWRSSAEKFNFFEELLLPRSSFIVSNIFSTPLQNQLTRTFFWRAPFLLSVVSFAEHSSADGLRVVAKSLSQPRSSTASHRAWRPHWPWRPHASHWAESMSFMEMKSGNTGYWWENHTKRKKWVCANWGSNRWPWELTTKGLILVYGQLISFWLILTPILCSAVLLLMLSCSLSLLSMKLWIHWNTGKKTHRFRCSSLLVSCIKQWSDEQTETNEATEKAKRFSTVLFLFLFGCFQISCFLFRSRITKWEWLDLFCSLTGSQQGWLF